MKNLIYFLVVISFLNINQAIGQDVVFSNPMLSPMNLNPALTGVINSQKRLQAIYRNQYSFLGNSSFNTFSMAYDQRFAVGRNDFWGAGITLLGDQAGELNFKTFQAKLSSSYSKRMGGRRSSPTYLVAGMELGVNRKSINLANAQWGNQHNGNGEFDPNVMPELEGFDRTAFSSLDFGAGLLFFINDEKNGKNLYIGGSYFHLNKNNQSFSMLNEVSPNQRITIHAGGEFPIDGPPKNIRLLPNITFHSHVPSMQLLTGIDVRFELVKNSLDQIYIKFGSSLRAVKALNKGFATDALILNTKVDYNQFSIGLSYDFTISKLASANNGAGGFELGLTYLFGENKRNVYCPKF